MCDVTLAEDYDDDVGDCPSGCPWHWYSDDPSREPDVVLIPLDGRPVAVVHLPEPSREDIPA